jgi:hypothetical protein
MRYIFIALMLAALTGCAHKKVSVIMDTCENKGTVEGRYVGSCELIDFPVK